MSKNIFINNLDTYVSQAIFKELRNDQPNEEGEENPDKHNIFGTYISKDSSLPPTGIKKMLKVSNFVALMATAAVTSSIRLFLTNSNLYFSFFSVRNPTWP